jgi:hypothetical protein
MVPIVVPFTFMDTPVNGSEEDASVTVPLTVIFCAKTDVQQNKNK